MNKQEFEAAVDRCREAIVSGSSWTRVTTKRVVLDEHARLYDGLQALRQQFHNRRLNAMLQDLIDGTNFAPSDPETAPRVTIISEPIWSTANGEELDRIGLKWGRPRAERGFKGCGNFESDHDYRARLAYAIMNDQRIAGTTPRVTIVDGQGQPDTYVDVFTCTGTYLDQFALMHELAPRGPGEDDSLLRTRILAHLKAGVVRAARDLNEYHRDIRAGVIKPVRTIIRLDEESGFTDGLPSSEGEA